MFNKLKLLFEESFARFLANEKDNIEDNVSERNLCGRLAIYLTQKLADYNLGEYYVDTEYNRKQGGQVKTILDEEMNVITIQTDLIVHSRGKNPVKDNLIAIEMKKASRPQIEKESDRKRLRAMTKESFDGIWSYDGRTHPENVCNYSVGIYIILDITRSKCSLEFFRKGQKVLETTQSFA